MTGVVTRATKGVPLTATDHDGNLEVIVSLHKSATEPSPTYGCMLWADTNNDLLKMRNKANDAWITLGALDTTGAFSDNNLADQDQLSELSDVTITSVADNEVLAYDSTASKWINQTASEAGLATSAQGSLADSALQDGDTASSLTITSADINGGTIDGVTIGGSSAPTVTNLGSVATCDINGGTIDGATIGGSSAGAITGTTVTATGLMTAQDGLVVDNDGATVATFDRATSDGTIAEFQKNGSAVGSIGNTGSALWIRGNSGLYFGSAKVLPTDNTGTVNDGVCDLGASALRFNDLYLSGGVYLGGTGAANYLDDYEEGTWTPTYLGSTTNPTVTYTSTTSGQYTKIGNMVFCRGDLRTDAFTGGSGGVLIGGLPFTTTNSPSNAGLAFLNVYSGDGASFAGDIPISGQTINNTTTAALQYRATSNGGWTALEMADMADGLFKNFIKFVIYYQV